MSLNSVTKIFKKNRLTVNEKKQIVSESMSKCHVISADLNVELFFHLLFLCVN